MEVGKVLSQSAQNEAVHYLNKLWNLAKENPLVFATANISVKDVEFISSYAQDFAKTQHDSTNYERVTRIVKSVEASGEMEQMHQTNRKQYINIGMGITRPLLRIFDKLTDNFNKELLTA